MQEKALEEQKAAELWSYEERMEAFKSPLSMKLDKIIETLDFWRAI